MWKKTSKQSSSLAYLRDLWMWDSFQIGAFLQPMLPGIAAIPYSAAAIGVWPKEGKAIAKSPLTRAFALLSLLLFISTAFADRPLEALGGMANFFPYFIWFCTVHFLIQTPSQLRKLAWLLVFSSLPICFLGLGQIFFGWITPEFWATLSGWTLIPYGKPEGRMSSAFMYANILAFYLLVILMLTLGLWIDAFRQWHADKQRQSLQVLRFLSGAIFLNSLSLLLTQSRNAWVLAILGSLAFAFYIGWRLLVLGIAACAGTIAWASFAPAWGGETLRQIVPYFFWGRLSGEMYPNMPIPLLRMTQWQFCGHLIRDRPLLGWGLRNFSFLYKDATDVWLGHPHNLFLMLAAETGIIATLLFCAIVGWILARGVLLLGNSVFGDRDRLILFTFFVAFITCIGFNFLDVSVFDLRINTLGWALLAAIAGVTRYQDCLHRQDS
ncbi:MULTISPECIES: O-antigen ligase family protein [Spirulina sp. CCY15215]|uniref:O-antigen ligase family protein n=1 Tax=Spirulina sp. CCY15215 TaxID=2767591 RepID=UPI00195037A0|nr:O-antigen ligase family protein [Spirulina major]